MLAARDTSSSPNSENFVPKARSSINEESIPLEPTDLAPHLEVIRPARATRLFDRIE
jgi:hypothetical protein